MGTWQKNKFHQLIFVNCFEIHWWKETWTENKKCQLLKFVCWIFHLWIYIYRISSHLLNYHLPILFRFLPLFLCTDGTLVIFLFTRGFVNTKERQVTSNRSYRHAQFEFATSSLSLCRQFKPLKRIHRTFFLLDTVYLSVSFQSHPERMTLFLQLIYDFSALIVFSLLLFFIPVLQWAWMKSMFCRWYCQWDCCRWWASHGSSSGVVLLAQFAVHFVRTFAPHCKNRYCSTRYK